MKIAGWAADGNGCGYYRVGLPLYALKAMGHQTVATTLLDESAMSADIIVGQRVCNPSPSSLWQQFAREGRTLVYELDDDLFAVERSNSAAYAFYKDFDVQRRIRENAAVASLVTVTGEPLAEVMRQYNDNVVVLPNCIDEKLLNLAESKPEHLTIGWAGSSTHAGDFGVAKDSLLRVSRDKIRPWFHFIGADYGSFLPRDQYTFTTFLEDIAMYYGAIARAFHVGIAPLAHNRFNTSKSAIKALEYGALGVPVVASAEAPYENFVVDGVTGFLAHNPEEWVRYLRDLIHDDALRELIGKQGREHAAEWTIQGNAHKWETAYQAVLA